MSFRKDEKTVQKKLRALTSRGDPAEEKRKVLLDIMAAIIYSCKRTKKVSKKKSEFYDFDEDEGA